MGRQAGEETDAAAARSQAMLGARCATPPTGWLASTPALMVPANPSRLPTAAHTQFGFDEDVVMLGALCVLWGILTYVLLALAGTPTADRMSRQWRAGVHACQARCVRAVCKVGALSAGLCLHMCV